MDARHGQKDRGGSLSRDSACVRGKEVSRFESISEIGMAVQLSLHLRGLPQLEYDRSSSWPLPSWAFRASQLIGSWACWRPSGSSRWCARGKTARRWYPGALFRCAV